MWFVPTAYAADTDVPVIIAPVELHLRSSVPPRFPSTPTADAARCLLRVMVGTSGAPEKVETRACDEPYASLAEDAVTTWRWDPPRSATGPARAVVLVPITFTPRGRAPVEAAERCTYNLVVSGSGVVRITGQSSAQCVVWAPDATPHRPPAAGACGVAVAGDIARQTPGWLDLAACPPEGQAFAADMLGRLLFSTGSISTRVMLTLPDPTMAPKALTMDVNRVGGDSSITRLGLDSDDAPAELDPPMQVTDTPVPEVDLSKLFGPDWQPPPETEPAPEKKPEEP